MNLVLQVILIGFIIDFHVLLIYLIIMMINKHVQIKQVKESASVDQGIIPTIVEEHKIYPSRYESPASSWVAPATMVLPDMKVETSFGDRRLGKTKIVEE